jgi:hypothetical protein
MYKRDQEAVLIGHSHLVLTLLHRSIDTKYHVGVVVDCVSVVVICEGVHCIDGEGGGGGGGGGGGSGGGRRLCSGSGDILLGVFLCWNRLHDRGRHGGVVIVIGGSVLGGGVGVGLGVSVNYFGVVIDALFVGGDFLV